MDRNISIIIAISIISLIAGALGGAYYYKTFNGDGVKIKDGTPQQDITDKNDKDITEKGDKNLFPVYGADEEVENIEVNFYIKISDDLMIKEKLKRLVDALSRFKFNYLPIEVVKLKEKSDDKIAVINLEEHQWNKEKDEVPELRGSAGVTWRSDYFQGSTGGQFTTATLTETLLQREYEGDWIDGVEILYQNKPIEQVAQHVPISGIVYRDKNQNEENKK